MSLTSLFSDLHRFVANHPDSWQPGTIKIHANPQGSTIQGVSYQSGQSGHARLAGEALLARARVLAEVASVIGAPWQCPGFVLHLQITSDRKLTWGANWVPEDFLPAYPAPQMKSTPACLEARMNHLRSGPSGKRRWETLGKALSGHSLVAGNAREAVAAAAALWRSQFEETSTHPQVAVAEIAGEHITIPPFNQWLNGPHDSAALDLMSEAVCAARAAVRRWDFPNERDFTTATLMLETNLGEDRDTPDYGLPCALSSSWDSDDYPGTGFCAQHAQMARSHLLAFGAMVMGLPVLANVPLALRAHITAIPGGDILMGMTLDAAQGDTHPVIGESDWREFSRAWAPRLGALESLHPNRPQFWQQHHHRNRQVRADTPQEAARVWTLLWAQGDRNYKVARMLRLPTWSELGITA